MAPPLHIKPVRKCHACPLNLGDRCWAFAEPRAQWRRGRRCPGPDDADLRAAFEAWRKRPQVKSRKELRQLSFRARPAPTAVAARRPKRADRH